MVLKVILVQLDFLGSQVCNVMHKLFYINEILGPAGPPGLGLPGNVYLLACNSGFLSLHRCSR